IVIRQGGRLPLKCSPLKKSKAVARLVYVCFVGLFIFACSFILYRTIQFYFFVGIMSSYAVNWEGDYGVSFVPCSTCSEPTLFTLVVVDERLNLPVVTGERSSMPVLKG